MEEERAQETFGTARAKREVYSDVYDGVSKKARFHKNMVNRGVTVNIIVKTDKVGSHCEYGNLQNMPSKDLC